MRGMTALVDSGLAICTELFSAAVKTGTYKDMCRETSQYFEQSVSKLMLLFNLVELASEQCQNYQSALTVTCNGGNPYCGSTTLFQFAPEISDFNKSLIENEIHQYDTRCNEPPAGFVIFLKVLLFGGAGVIGLMCLGGGLNLIRRNVDWDALRGRFAGCCFNHVREEAPVDETGYRHLGSELEMVAGETQQPPVAAPGTPQGNRTDGDIELALD